MHVNIHEAKTHFSKLVERALAGEEVIISRNGKALLVLTPLAPSKEPRRPGLSAGRGTLAEDFDAPLDPGIMAEFE